jgi:hypothetical protein
MKQSLLLLLCCALLVPSDICIGQVITHDSCVDSTRRVLGPFAGEYDVRAAFRNGPARWDSSAAHSRFAWEFGGCLMREDFSGSRFDEPYQYIAIWGTSGVAPQRVQRIFVHSQHGLLGLSEGGWNAAGDSLIVEDSAFIRGQWIRQRNVLSRPREGSFVSQSWRSEDEGHTWFLTQRAQYVRHGPQPAGAQTGTCPRRHSRGW